jgi:hypothetical protein
LKARIRRRRGRGRRSRRKGRARTVTTDLQGCHHDTRGGTRLYLLLALHPLYSMVSFPTLLSH